MIIPNLQISVDSQMRIAIRNLTAQTRAAYDNAVFSNRLQRLVFNIKTGEFWTEQAPLGYKGRPPSVDLENSPESLKADSLKNLLRDFDQEAKNFENRPVSLSSEEKKTSYSIRSIPVVKRNVLIPVEWKEINDSISYRQSLPGKIMIAQFFSSISNTVLDRSTVTSTNEKEKDKNPKYFGYIYFLPDGTTTGASIRLAVKNNNNLVAENGQKYTLNLNTLTGYVHLLEGFQSANFTLPKK